MLEFSEAKSKGANVKESYPLAWPDGWPRTLLRDRRERKAWKDTLMSQIIFKLNKAELIDKDGNIIRLRRI